MSPGRFQTQDERDLAGIAAKQRRESETPEYVDEDLTAQFQTGSISSEQYTERRGKRPTLDAFFRRLERQNTMLVDALINRGKERRALLWRALGIVGAIVGIVSTIVGAYFAAKAGAGR